jgi:hypothetical protein
MKHKCMDKGWMRSDGRCEGGERRIREGEGRGEEDSFLLVGISFRRGGRVILGKHWGRVN